jgi:hypothetical protein
MAYRPHVEHNPAAREAAKSFKATEVWWSRWTVLERFFVKFAPDPTKSLARR